MKRILSIDFGATRIKAVVLDEMPTLESLKNCDVKYRNRHGWFNDSLPNIVDPNYWYSFTNYDNFQFDEVVIDGPWSVKSNLIKSDYQIPNDISSRISNVLNKPVIQINNDAEAWLKGFRYFQFLKGQLDSIEYPILAITLGTGIGLSYAASYNDIHELQFNHLDNSFPRLSKIKKFDHTYDYHDFLSKTFFSEIEDKMNYDDLRYLFTQRVVALYEDIVVNPTYLKGCKRPLTLVIGGGNANYVSKSMLLKKLHINIEIIRDIDFELKADIIPLLGNIYLPELLEKKNRNRTLEVLRTPS